MQYTRDNLLIMIPGPTPSNSKTFKTSSTRIFAHNEAEFIRYYNQVLNNLRNIFKVSNNYSPVVISGSGTLAMDMAMINLIDKSKNQNVLICISGVFGSRFKQIAKSYDIPYSTINSEFGEKINMSNFEDAVRHEKPDFAFIQHVDTSTGVANDIEEFSKICSENGVISVVDGVCSVGGMPTYQEKWYTDIYLTGAQKALATPPGLAILMYSEFAKEISSQVTDPINSYYLNLNNWWEIMDAYDNQSMKYYSTPPTNLIVTLCDATDQILSEGLEYRWQRHEDNAIYFRKRISELGFDFITNIDAMASTLSAIKYKARTNPLLFRNQMLDNGVLIAGGIYPGHQQEYFRIGHMGNIGRDEIDFTLDAINKTLNN